MRKKSEPFLDLEHLKGRSPELRMDGGSDLGPITFPATKTGLRKAGEYLYNNGFETWSTSSSCDFPQEYGCRVLSVHGTIAEGFRKAAGVKETPRQELLAKMFKFCSGKTFQACLNKRQKEIFEDLKKEMVGELMS